MLSGTFVKCNTVDGMEGEIRFSQKPGVDQEGQRPRLQPEPCNREKEELNSHWERIKLLEISRATVTSYLEIRPFSAADQVGGGLPKNDNKWWSNA